MSSLKINDAVLKRLLTSRGGPVGRIIDQKASLIYDNAKNNIQNNLMSRSGDLEAALRKIPIEDASGYHVAVGSDAQHRGFSYARALETGINPLNGEPMNIRSGTAFMVPAVRQSGFRLRKA